MPSAQEISQLDAAFKATPLNQAAEEYRLHVEWRQLENRTALDPEVVAAKKEAAAAKTDLERRARLRVYYTVYYAHMSALASAPDVKAYLDAKKAAMLASLAQPRVRPTPAPHSSQER